MRREINAQHRFVRSDHESAVAYDALDPELQLWVAAACSGGVVDTVTLLYGPVNDEGFTTLLKRSAPFATTLQVSESRWPTDRESFEAYWHGRVRRRAHGRRHSRLFARSRFVGLPARSARATPGTESPIPHRRFSPAPFREELGLAWTSRNQQRFVRSLLVRRGQPPPTEGDREFPWNIIEYDTHDGSLGTARPLIDSRVICRSSIGSDRRRHGESPKAVAFEKHER